MQFLANENFPKPSIILLRQNNINIVSISEHSPGLTDKQVMDIAVNEKRTILTHDSDYDELIFKHGHKPQDGVIFF
jgi:predicted nuclease of predicted toxin-antitoxin system